MTDTPASWLPDPTGRHDHRYWNGTGWTEHVADAGVAAIEPYEPAPPPAPAPGPAIGDDDPTQPGWAAPQDEPAPASGESPSAADDPTAVHGAVWSDPTEVVPTTEPAATQPVVSEPVVVEPAVAEPAIETTPPAGGSTGGSGGRSRKLVVGLGVLAIVAVVGVAVALTSGGGSTNASTSADGQPVAEQLAGWLRSADGFGASDATCIANFMVDRLGVARVRSLDLTADQAGLDLPSDVVKAMGDGQAHCKVATPFIGDGTATSTTVNPSAAQSTQSFFQQYYQSTLGLTPAQAQCLATAIIDAVTSGRVNLGSAAAQLPTALQTCHIPQDALKHLSG